VGGQGRGRGRLWRQREPRARRRWAAGGGVHPGATQGSVVNSGARRRTNWLAGFRGKEQGGRAGGVPTAGAELAYGSGNVAVNSTADSVTNGAAGKPLGLGRSASMDILSNPFPPKTNGSTNSTSSTFSTPLANGATEYCDRWGQRQLGPFRPAVQPVSSLPLPRLLHTLVHLHLLHFLQVPSFLSILPLPFCSARKTGWRWEAPGWQSAQPGWRRRAPGSRQAVHGAPSRACGAAHPHRHRSPSSTPAHPTAPAPSPRAARRSPGPPPCPATGAPCPPCLVCRKHPLPPRAPAAPVRPLPRALYPTSPAYTRAV